MAETQDQQTSSSLLAKSSSSHDNQQSLLNTMPPPPIQMPLLHLPPATPTLGPTTTLTAGFSLGSPISPLQSALSSSLLVKTMSSSGS